MSVFGTPTDSAEEAYFEHVGLDDVALAERHQAGGPRYAHALYPRGAFEEALRVMKEHIAQSETSAPVYDAERLFILTELPDGPARALAAYRDGTHGNACGLFALDREMVLRLLGRRPEAIQACRRQRERFTRGVPPWVLEWYQYYADYLCDTISADELLEAAGNSRNNQCEAHFLIGLDFLARGNRTAAGEHFQKSINTQVFEIHPTKAYFVWWMARILSLKNSWSRKP